MQIKLDNLREFLLKKWAYKPSQVDTIIEDILALDPDILAAFESWYKTGELSEMPVVCGHNPKLICESYPLKPPAGFLLLGWLRRDQEEALKALRYEYGIPGHIQTETET